MDAINAFIKAVTGLHFSLLGRMTGYSRALRAVQDNMAPGDYLTGSAVVEPGAKWTGPMHSSSDVDAVFKGEGVFKRIQAIVTTLGEPYHFVGPGLCRITGSVGVDIRIVWPKEPRRAVPADIEVAQTYLRAIDGVRFPEPNQAFSQGLGKLYQGIRNDSDLLLWIELQKSVDSRVPGLVFALAAGFAGYVMSDKQLDLAWNNQFLVKAELANAMMVLLATGRVTALFAGNHGRNEAQLRKAAVDRVPVFWRDFMVTHFGGEWSHFEKQRHWNPWCDIHGGGVGLGTVIQQFLFSMLTPPQQNRLGFYLQNTFVNAQRRLGLASQPLFNIPFVALDMGFSTMRYMLVWFSQRATLSEDVVRLIAHSGFMGTLCVGGQNLETVLPYGLVPLWHHLDARSDGQFITWLHRKPSKVRGAVGSNVAALQLLTQIMGDLEALPAIEPLQVPAEFRMVDTDYEVLAGAGAPYYLSYSQKFVPTLRVQPPRAAADPPQHDPVVHEELEVADWAAAQ